MKNSIQHAEALPMPWIPFVDRATVKAIQVDGGKQDDEIPCPFTESALPMKTQMTLFAPGTSG